MPVSHVHLVGDSGELSVAAAASSVIYGAPPPPPLSGGSQRSEPHRRELIS